MLKKVLAVLLAALFLAACAGTNRMSNGCIALGDTAANKDSGLTINEDGSAWATEAFMKSSRYTNVLSGLLYRNGDPDAKGNQKLRISSVCGNTSTFWNRWEAQTGKTAPAPAKTAVPAAARFDWNPLVILGAISLLILALARAGTNPRAVRA